MKDAHVASLQARGKDSSYIDGVPAYVNTGTFFTRDSGTGTCVARRLVWAKRMLKKHFAKTGIIWMALTQEPNCT